MPAKPRGYPRVVADRDWSLSRARFASVHYIRPATGPGSRAPLNWPPASYGCAVFHYPDFSPIAFSIGPLHVRWYGLMYLGGFALGWLGCARAREARSTRRSMSHGSTTSSSMPRSASSSAGGSATCCSMDSRGSSRTRSASLRYGAAECRFTAASSACSSRWRCSRGGSICRSLPSWILSRLGYRRASGWVASATSSTASCGERPRARCSLGRHRRRRAPARVAALRGVSRGAGAVPDCVVVFSAKPRPLHGRVGRCLRSVYGIFRCRDRVRSHARRAARLSRLRLAHDGPGLVGCR